MAGLGQVRFSNEYVQCEAVSWGHLLVPPPHAAPHTALANIAQQRMFGWS